MITERLDKGITENEETGDSELAEDAYAHLMTRDIPLANVIAMYR